jgi:hypothetical protein
LVPVAGAERCRPRPVSWVKILSTPGTASAAAVSIALIEPLAMPLDTTRPWARSGTLNSAAYFAAPVTLARPSIGCVGHRHGSQCKSFEAASINPFIGLGLRRAGRRLAERAYDGATSKLDLEGIVDVSLGILQDVSGGCGKLSVVAGPPLKSSSASGSRQGLCATPPSARRATRIRSPSISSPAATETRANT